MRLGVDENGRRRTRNAISADGCEADLDAHASNCGVCGATCFGGTCTAGSCVCPPGRAACSGTCIDVTTDRANCGGCGIECGLGAVCASSSCSPDVVWALSFGARTRADHIQAFTGDTDGNLYALVNFEISLPLPDSTLTSAGGYDGALVAFDGSGAVRWTRRFGSTADDALFAVTTDAAGNVYIGGWVWSPTIDLGGGALTRTGARDVAVASFSRDGTHRWSRLLPANGYDTLLRRMAMDPSGDRLVAVGSMGGTLDAGGGERSAVGAFVVALDAATGAHAWDRVLPSTTPVTAQSVAVDVSGRAYVGIDYDDIDLGGGPLGRGGGVVALDSGGVRWSRTYEEIGVFDVVLHGSHVVLLAKAFDAAPDFGGGTIGMLGVPKQFLVRFDRDGAWVRQRLLYQGASAGIELLRAAPLPSGGLVLGGSMRSATDLGLGPLGSGDPARPFFAGLDASDATAWNITFAKTSTSWFVGIAALPGGDVAGGGLLTGNYVFGASSFMAPSTPEAIVVRVSP